MEIENLETYFLTTIYTLLPFWKSSWLPHPEYTYPNLIIVTRKIFCTIYLHVYTFWVISIINLIVLGGNLHHIQSSGDIFHLVFKVN